MLSFLQSEAELVAVLGHEIAHVDERHCIERYTYALRLGKVGLGVPGAVLDVARQITAIGYSKYQEADADVAGMRMMIEAGYYPMAAPQVFARLALEQGRRSQTAPASLVTEAERAAERALGSYFDSHPAAEDRAVRLRARIQSTRNRFEGHSFYVGVANYRNRVARPSRELAGERFTVNLSTRR